VNTADRPTSLLGRAARDVDSLKSAITHALANVRATLDDARLPEMRRALERLRDEADTVADLLGRLGAHDDATRHRVVRVEDVIDRALETLSPVRQVHRTVRHGLPPVAGHPGRLTRMVHLLLRGGDEPGSVTVETDTRAGALVNERIVEIRIVGRGDATSPDEADLQMALAIARDHGGFVDVERTSDGWVATARLQAL
jgi:hypothetical protein